MMTHGYSLISTPLDLHASREELVRIYEFVRRDIYHIVPFLPKTAEVDLIAGGTSHNLGPVPLLGIHFEHGDALCLDRIDLCKIQDAIDRWFDEQDPDILEQNLADIRFPTWAHLVAVGSYPGQNYEL